MKQYVSEDWKQNGALQSDGGSIGTHITAKHQVIYVLTPSQRLPILRQLPIFISRVLYIALILQLSFTNNSRDICVLMDYRFNPSQKMHLLSWTMCSYSFRDIICRLIAFLCYEAVFQLKREMRNFMLLLNFTPLSVNVCLSVTLYSE